MMQICAVLVTLATLTCAEAHGALAQDPFQIPPSTIEQQAQQRITGQWPSLEAMQNEMLPHTEWSSSAQQMLVRSHRSLSQASTQDPPRFANCTAEVLADTSLPLGTNCCALLQAAARRVVRPVERLLENCANVTVQDFFCKTPLHVATAWGNLHIARALVAAGVNVSAEDMFGRSALQLASGANRRGVVRLLLESGAVINTRPTMGLPPLLAAAERGYSGIVRDLLSAGADIETKKHGETALMRAARAGKNSVVRVLLARGADVSATSDEGRTALHEAAGARYSKVVRSMVRSLVRAGADARAKDKEGATPLTIAAREGHGEIVQMLLEGAADVHATTVRGETALH